MNKKSSILLLTIILANLGCFRRFTMSEKEIENYYNTHYPKPNFHTYQFEKKTIFYAFANEERKDLPLLIFIHGAPGAWYGYIHFLDDTLLLKKFRIISVDRLGYNNSYKGGSEVSIERQAKSLAPLLEFSFGKKCIIVGRSYGAPIAAKICADYHNKADGLLLISSASDPNHEKFWWFSKPVYYPPLRWLFPRMIRVASDEKFAHISELKKLIPDWQLVTQPSIIMQGAKDFIIHPNNGKFTDSVLINSPHKYLLLSENGHLISNENPEIIKKSIMEILKKIE